MRTGNMISGWIAHHAIRLADGTVLILPGGEGDPTIGEIYDPRIGSFRQTGWKWIYDSSVAGSANLLPNGRVLMTVVPAECDAAEIEAGTL